MAIKINPSKLKVKWEDCAPLLGTSARPAIQNHHRGHYRNASTTTELFWGVLLKRRKHQNNKWPSGVERTNTRQLEVLYPIKQRWNTLKLSITKGNLHIYTELDLHKLLSTTRKMKLVHQKITFKNLFHLAIWQLTLINSLCRLIRRIIVNLRSAWSTQWVLGQLGIW